MADRYATQQNIVFAKLVVDGEGKMLAQARFKEVKVTPTFQLYQDGTKVDETVNTMIFHWISHLHLSDDVPCCVVQVGVAETAEIMSGVKGMLAPWIGDALTQEPSDDAVQPSDIAPAPSDVAPAPARAQAEDEGGMSPGDCAGPEGCEIVWD